jgi:hypothetical protein
MACAFVMEVMLELIRYLALSLGHLSYVKFDCHWFYLLIGFNCSLPYSSVAKVKAKKLQYFNTTLS